MTVKKKAAKKKAAPRRAPSALDTITAAAAVLAPSVLPSREARIAAAMLTGCSEVVRAAREDAGQ